MVDHAVGLEDVAVVVAVALVLDVVVRPGEVGLRVRERRHGVDRQLARAERVVGVALHVLDGAGLVDALLVLEAEARAVVRLGVGHGDPRRRRAVHGVGAARHLLVHVLHRVAGDVEAGLAVGAGEVGAHALRDALVGEQHLVEVLGGEVRHPHRVVVLEVVVGRVRDVVVQRSALHLAGLALRRAELGRHVRPGEVVVRVLVELDEDREELRLLRRRGLLGVLQLLRALAGRDRLRLELRESASGDRVALAELAVERVGLLDRGIRRIGAAAATPPEIEPAATSSSVPKASSARGET